MNKNNIFNSKVLKFFQAIEALNIINPDDRWENLKLNKIKDYIDKEQDKFNNSNKKYNNKLPKKNYRWYFGIFKEQIGYDILFKYFKGNEIAYDNNKSKENTFIFSFDTDNEGKIISNKIEFQEIINLLIFLMNESTLKEYLDYRYKDSYSLEHNFIAKKIKMIEKELTKQFQNKTINEIIDNITEKIEDILYDLKLSIKPEFLKQQDNNLSIKVESYIYVVQFEENKKDSYIKNFFMNDIKKAIEESQNNKLSNNLKKYLSIDNELQKDVKDFKNNSTLITEILNLDNWSNGKWPQQLDHHLVLMQQVAVNTIINNNGQDLIAVNGPPGTGKTTLLKEIFVDNLVKRAEVLASYEQAEYAFIEHQNKNGTLTQFLKPELHNFLMIVASSNNTAVENISLELPKINSLSYDIYGKELKEIDYFSNIDLVK